MASAAYPFVGRYAFASDVSETNSSVGSCEARGELVLRPDGLFAYTYRRTRSDKHYTGITAREASGGWQTAEQKVTLPDGAQAAVRGVLCTPTLGTRTKSERFGTVNETTINVWRIPLFFAVAGNEARGAVPVASEASPGGDDGAPLVLALTYETKRAAVKDRAFVKVSHDTGLSIEAGSPSPAVVADRSEAAPAGARGGGSDAGYRALPGPQGSGAAGDMGGVRASAAANIAGIRARAASRSAGNTDAVARAAAARQARLARRMVGAANAATVPGHATVDYPRTAVQSVEPAIGGALGARPGYVGPAARGVAEAAYRAEFEAGVGGGGPSGPVPLPRLRDFAVQTEPQVGIWGEGTSVDGGLDSTSGADGAWTPLPSPAPGTEWLLEVGLPAGPRDGVGMTMACPACATRLRVVQRQAAKSASPPRK